MATRSDRLLLRRFTGVQRLFHLGLVILFMLLSVTGLAWMYIETTWGNALADLFGGYTNTIYIHRIAGLIMLLGFAGKVIYLIWNIDWSNLRSSLFGPDSMVLLWSDVKSFFRQLRWMFGLGEAPRFDRWSWWEKFDYWAVWWGLIILGVTGLLIYDSVLSSNFVPGWLYNVALWVHRIEALLAMGHIFTVHFFIENFRPTNFPFSATMFDGGMELSHARSEHGLWVERLEREGALERQLFPVPPLPIRILHVFFGYSMIMLGVFLVIYSIINVFALTIVGS